MTTNTIQAIEQNLEQSRKTVELGKAFERLVANRDFKAIIQDGYFRDEAVRLVHLKADPAMQSPVSQAAIVAQIDAIGALSAYFRTLKHGVMLAVKAIEADEETLQELRAGDA